jgi:hypothetical protein
MAIKPLKMDQIDLSHLVGQFDSLTEKSQQMLRDAMPQGESKEFYRGVVYGLGIAWAKCKLNAEDENGIVAMTAVAAKMVGEAK